MKQLFFFLFISFVFITNAQIDYTLKMSNPQSHYFEVEMDIQNIKGEEIEIKMPVWAPGSYLVRDFSKNVNQVKAFDANGKSLEVHKTKKNAWMISNGKAKNITVKYEVYAFELSVRTSFLDLSHGFVSGTGVFMYTENFRNKSGKLTVIPYSSFSKISTALEQIGEGVVSDGTQVFIYSDYDELVDSPIEIGNQTIFEFTSSGCKHIVALYGEGNYDINKLKLDMAKITDAATSIYGENPNKRYVFIIHNVTNAQGGLEHKSSTTLSVNRFTYSEDKYVRFLTLVAHEYFHLWNVKRLRAKELGPFNYDEEVYTPLLYVMEGFTSFYEDQIVYKAGYISAIDYLKTIEGSINYYVGNVGSSVQSIADASFDAWIKAYKPNENSANTTVSYYSGGGMIASLMDALIIAKFKGEKTLDDFMRLLYQKYYIAKNVGFTNVEFENNFSEFMGEDMDWFFTKHVRGVEVPDFKSIFGAIGIDIMDLTASQPSLGITVNSAGIITGIRAGSTAEKSGLSVYDKIIGIDGNELEGSKVSEYLKDIILDDHVMFSILRDNFVMEFKVNVEYYKKPYFKFLFYDNQINNRIIKAFFRKQ